MLADQHPDVRPSVVVSRQQHALMPKRINETLTHSLRVRLHIWPKPMRLIAHGTHPPAHHPRPQPSDESNQPGMAKLHGWRPCLFVSGQLSVALAEASI